MSNDKCAGKSLGPAEGKEGFAAHPPPWGYLGLPSRVHHLPIATSPLLFLSLSFSLPVEQTKNSFLGEALLLKMQTDYKLKIIFSSREEQGESQRDHLVEPREDRGTPHTHRAACKPRAPTHAGHRWGFGGPGHPVDVQSVAHFKSWPPALGTCSAAEC